MAEVSALFKRLCHIFFFFFHLSFRSVIAPKSQHHKTLTFSVSFRFSSYFLVYENDPGRTFIAKWRATEGRRQRGKCPSGCSADVTGHLGEAEKHISRNGLKVVVYPRRLFRLEFRECPERRIGGVEGNGDANSSSHSSFFFYSVYILW